MAFTGSSDDAGAQLGLISVAAIPGVINVGKTLLGGLDKGSKGPYPLVGMNNATDQARSARAYAYQLGAEAGSVKSARLALGARQTRGAVTEQALYDRVLQGITQYAPDVMAQARAAGPLHDSDDGRQGLEELWALQIPFTAPWAGHATSDHSVIDQGSVELAEKLAGLAGIGPYADTKLPNGAPTPTGDVYLMPPPWTGAVPPSSGGTAGAAGGGVVAGGGHYPAGSGGLTQPAGTPGVATAGIGGPLAIALGIGLALAFTRRR